MNAIEFAIAVLVALAIVVMLSACHVYRDCRRWGFAPAQCAAFVVHMESKDGWR
jgi:hypothetical protein